MNACARACRAFAVTLLLTALTTLAACQGGGADLARAYALYDSRVDRALVAGHDEARGDYVEVRFSPRRTDGKSMIRPEGAR